MKINLELEILTFKKVPFIDGEGKNLNLRSVLMEHVGMYKASSGAEAVKMWSIGVKLAESSGEIEINSDEVALIKKALDSPIMAAIIVAQAVNALNEGSIIVEEKTNIRLTRS